MPVLEQERICESQPATQIMIDTYMAALGFEKDGETGHFKSEIVLGTGTWVTKRRPSTTCPRDCSLLNCSGFPNCCRFFQFTWDKTHLSPASLRGLSVLLTNH